MLKKGTITLALQEFITECDKIYEDLIFGFPHHIKTKVISKYQGKKSQPNYSSLSFLATADAINNSKADIVEIV
jgi:hypothetical protein